MYPISDNEDFVDCVQEVELEFDVRVFVEESFSDFNINTIDIMRFTQESDPTSSAIFLHTIPENISQNEIRDTLLKLRRLNVGHVLIFGPSNAYSSHGTA